MQGDTGWKSRHIVRPIATLKQQVVAGLRGSIEDLRFKPGERLVERELCEMLGVSRTLVREGLSQLAAEGLVQIIPHKGPIVAVLGSREAAGIYEVRAHLEPLAARRFASNATPDEKKALRLALEDLKKPGDADPARHFVRAGARFYEVLAAGSGNPILEEVLRLLHIRITLLRSRNLSHPGRLDKSFRELRAIVVAAEQSDPDAAAEAAEHHVQEAQKLALSLIGPDPEPGRLTRPPKK
jgi:DNA-binding GntR family transcriptional regulator